MFRVEGFSIDPARVSLNRIHLTSLHPEPPRPDLLPMSPFTAMIPQVLDFSVFLLRGFNLSC